MTEPLRESPIGQSPPRPDGPGKVTGETRYLDDLEIPGVWYGATVRSKFAAGRLRKVDGSAARALGAVVVTAADLPGPNVLKVIADDWPVLASERVEHVAQPIALVAAPTRELARRAAEAVVVEVEPETAVLEANDPSTILPSGRDRVLASCKSARGDAAGALANPALVVVEGVYSTGHQEHAYIEPQGAVAIPDRAGHYEIIGSIQCPYYVHGALEHIFGVGSVRVRQSPTGGGFGGKEEFPDMLCAHVALLARASGHPVKIVYERSEDINGTTKRHPARVRIRSGHAPDGTMLAAEIEAVFDGGAFITLSPVVLSRAVLHAGGPYRCDNITIDGRVLATNTAPNGAFRGFGAPQTQFAMERHMDRAARALGLDPLTMRAINAYRPGDITPTGQVLGADTTAIDCLRAALERIDFRSRWLLNERARSAFHARGMPTPGIGISLFWHGTGFTGNGERRMRSPVQLALLKDGTFEIRVAATDFGQGTEIVLEQIVADALGCGLERVRCAEPDTDRVPNSGPTVASRTVSVVGGTLHEAGLLLAGELARAGGDVAELLAGEDELVVETHFEPDPNSSFDEATYQGDAYNAYSFGCDVIEVEVDPDSLATTVKRALFVADVGHAIHPVLCAGQLEGGALQAIGQGTIEEIRLEDGRYLQDRLTNYLIPTAQDAPDMDTILLEHASHLGPAGAKGVGELPADGGAPAVIAAIENATGIICCDAPATPERLLADLRAGRVVRGDKAVDGFGLELLR